MALRIFSVGLVTVSLRKSEYTMFIPLPPNRHYILKRPEFAFSFFVIEDGRRDDPQR
jgi:hypothetical protein